MTSNEIRVVVAALALALAAEPASTADKPAGLPVAGLARETPVDFETELLPVLKNNCLACHNQTKAKGGLNLETPPSMLKGGDSGPAIVPGKGAESLVFKAAAHRDPELIMPPKDNKANAADLSPGQIALLKLWIDQGARGEVHSTAPVKWLEHPPVLDPIFAVALTPDGQFAVCGRGNRVDVYHLLSGRLAARLVDPQLNAAGLTNAAHRDLVNALAFHPDGTLLASAGYREVKLWRRPRNTRRDLPSVTNVTSSLFALSPDRRWLATPGGERTVSLFDLSSGRLVHQLAGPTNQVTALDFSPDAARLASGLEDGTVWIWNISDGTFAATASTPAAIRAIAWPEARRVAAGGDDWVVRIWQLSEGGTNLVLHRELDDHVGPVTALAAAPDGQGLISGGADGMVRWWNIEEGELRRGVEHGGWVTSVAVRPDGKRLAASGTDGVTRLWDPEEGRRIADLKGNRHAIERVAEGERNLLVARGDVEFRNKAVEAAEAEHKKQTERVAKATETNSVTEKVLAEKDKALKDAQAAKVSAEKALADLLAEIEKVTTGFEKAEKAAKDASAQARVASEKTAQAQVVAERAIAAKIDAEKIAADTASVAARTRAAVGTADAARETARRIAEESAAVAEKSKAFADALVADAEMKARLAADAKAAAEKAIDDVASTSFAAGRLRPDYEKTLAEAPEKRKQATNRVESANKALPAAEQERKRAETRKAVTSHELELAQAAQKRAADRLAEAKSAQTLAQSALKETEASLDRSRREEAAAHVPVRALAFSPDGLTLATVGDDRQVRTWSAESGAAFEAVGGLDTHRDAARSSAPHLAFITADVVLAASGAGSVVAWDLAPAWTLERTLGTGEIDSPLTERVNAVRFSPDGRTLATGAGEPTRSGEIKLWNTADGKFLHEFQNVHSDAVLSLDFSPDGKYLASSSADRFVRVSDLGHGKVVRAFEGHTSYVLGVAWKRDSRTLASAGADNVVKVWDFVTGERRKNIDGATKEVTSIAFVGVSGEAIVSSGDSQVRLVRENGDKVRSFEGASDFMHSAAATPDGRIIVAGGQDGVMRVWNGSDGKPLATFAPTVGK